VLSLLQRMGPSVRVALALLGTGCLATMAAAGCSLLVHDVTAKRIVWVVSGCVVAAGVPVLSVLVRGWEGGEDKEAAAPHPGHHVSARPSASRRSRPRP
jgi:hypothetical protein